MVELYLLPSFPRVNSRDKSSPSGPAVENCLKRSCPGSRVCVCVCVGGGGGKLKKSKNLHYADTLGTFPSVRLIEVVKIAQCLLTINIQRLLCTVIKLHVVKEAIQSSSSLPFITNFNLFVNAKTLTDFSTYFKDVIQYYYCQFSPVSA